MRSVIPKNVFLMPPEAKRVFEGIIFDVYQWQQRLFDGSETTFEMIKRPDTVVILAVKDGKIVALDEEQPGHARGFCMPGGRHDVEEEDELAAAKRELREETGMTFKTWRLLDVYKPQLKIDWFVYTFLATDFEAQGEPHVDAGEKIEVKLVDYEQCLALEEIKSGSRVLLDLLKQAGSIDGLLKLPEYH